MGFGTAQFSGSTLLGGRQVGMGKINIKEISDAINFAVDNGINFFDTADIYGMGLSEKIIGKTLNKRINDVFICTKFGNREINGNSFQDFSSEWLIKSVNGSLKRLGRDYLDYLLLHSPPDDFDWSNYDFSTLNKLVDQGKIISFGISCHSFRGAERLLNIPDIKALEVIYNVIDRRIENKVLKHERINQITVIVRLPLCMGYLSERYLKSLPNYSTDDFRSKIKKDQSDWLVESVRKLDFLNDLEGGLSTSAIRFCLSNNNIDTVIPGMRNVDQVRKNIKANNLGSLSTEIIDKIRETISDVHPDWK